MPRTEGLAAVLDAQACRRQIALQPTIFQTMAPLALWSWRNRIDFHTWSSSECRLAKGATSATLVVTGGGQGPLQPGDFLILAETASPQTGLAADQDPDLRHLVRLVSVLAVTDPLVGASLVKVTWAPADALPFDLILQARPAGASAASAAIVTAHAYGNVTLADHGVSLPPPPHLGLTPAETEALRPGLSPPMALPGLVWRPRLDRADVARIAPADFAGPPFAPAAALRAVASVACLPALTLADDFSVWDSRADLLESGGFDRDFVVETGLDGRASLRFGDAINGLAPAPGAALIASGRFGTGPSGNLGHGSLAHVVLPAAQLGARVQVMNPLAAQGGTAPETAASVRVNAPEAFRVHDRAVTEADYAWAAVQHPEVANALAIARWTGAWQTMVIYLDRKGGAPVDAAFQTDLGRWIAHYRLMGFDVALRPARPKPLDIVLRVCARPDQIRAVVGARVRRSLRPFGPADGSPGFFHPDNFTFGAPLYLSRLIAAVMAVEGVESVLPLRFQRLGKLPQSEVQAGAIRPGEAEILLLDDDPSFPERGRLALTLGGGR